MKILYKALTIDGKWVKGLPRYDGDSLAAITTFQEYGTGDCYNVYRDSIAQFVGLTDQNNVEIFCGDIVKHYNAWNLGNHTDYIEGQIFWDEHKCCFKIRHSDENTTFRYGSNEFYLSDDCVYEVIGNSYEDLTLASFDTCWDGDKDFCVSSELQDLTDAINEMFGSDAMYYGVDSLAVAGKVIDRGFIKAGDWVFPSEKMLGEDEVALVMTTKEHFYINTLPDTQEGCCGEICCYLPLAPAPQT